MTIDLEKLEALAKAATPGPWKADTESGPNIVWYDVENSGVIICDGISQGDCRYIAAMSPDVVLNLIGELREARHYLEWDD